MDGDWRGAGRKNASRESAIATTDLDDQATLRARHLTARGIR